MKGGKGILQECKKYRESEKCKENRNIWQTREYRKYEANENYKKNRQDRVKRN